jgi:protocatechuate 3,4-dioxygenase beta subunit
LGHGIGLGSLFLAGCGTRDSVGGPLLPTPAIPDDDDGPPVLAKAGPVCEATADNIEGPFYKAGAPSRATLVGERDRGERFVLTGSVRSTECEPLAGAVLDVWHADWRGDYDNEGFTYRGTLATDARGRFTLRTIIPGRYLNGRRYRPAHIHVKLRARGRETLTTQLYFEGDPYIEGDPFVVSSLVMPHEKAGAVRRAAFDFVLG